MSCSIEQILDPATQKNIDKGVEDLSVKIKKVVDTGDSLECQASQTDRMIAVANIVIQCIILGFVVLALFNHEKAGLIVKIIQWTTYLSLFLLAVQYRNIITTSLRLVSALDLSTKIIIFLSVAASLGISSVQKGEAGMRLTIAIAMVLFVRLSLQMKDFLLDEKSRVPAFLAFIKEIFTPARITTIYNAF